MLAGCGAPEWPEQHFPEQVEVEQTLFAESSYGMREGCTAILVELTERSSTLLQNPTRRVNGRWVTDPPKGWTASPVKAGEGQSYYEAALNGCNDEGRRPLGDMAGAMQRPGAYFRKLNNGEGIAIIIPRAKLAGFFYFG